MNQVKELLNKKRDGLSKSRAINIKRKYKDDDKNHSQSLDVYGNAYRSYNKGFDSLAPIVLELVEALKKISCDKTRCTALGSGDTWCPVCLAQDALSKFDKFLGGEK